MIRNKKLTNSKKRFLLPKNNITNLLIELTININFTS